jgi:ribosomal protein S18 acetylase RimI-like enzyme
VIDAIERIERSAYAAWSPDETVEIGGWTVASSGGFTRRLNSATTTHDADTSLETKNAIVAWLAERGAPLTIRVTPLMPSTVVEACTASWAVAPVDETIVLTRKPVRSIGGRGVQVIDPADDVFTRELMSLNGRCDGDVEPWGRVVGRVAPNAAGLWIPGEAVAFVAVTEEIASVFSLAVRPEHRRRGLARRMMNTAFNWASERDAATMFLQVLETNEPALALYDCLRFNEVYRYHYLVPSPGQRIDP